jgi:type IV pilus assembly protein PilB
MVDKESLPRQATYRGRGEVSRQAGGSANAPAGPPEGASLGRSLGRILVSEGLITADQLSEALSEQKGSRERLGAIFLRRGNITEDQLVAVLSSQYKVPAIVLPEAGLPPDVLKLVPALFARKYEAVPVARTPTTVTLAMVDPTNLSALDEAAFRTGLKVAPAVARPSAIRRAVEQYYGVDASALAEVLDQAQAGDVEIVAGDPTVESVDLRELRASADDMPVIRLVNMIVLDAVRSRASDIHFEPDLNCFRVRFRIDGVLRRVMSPPKRLEAAVLSRIKIMANLDIAERRLPQDGRIKLRHSGREIDIRVATLPMVFGEGVAMRILDRQAITLDLGTLGFDARGLEELRKAIRSTSGIVIITGPTGSGKTTTLYAAVEELKSSDLNIVTAEDPVEYNIGGVNQVQVNEALGLTFPAVLRSFLRHDPNVLLVGEIRDLETAQIAIRAALTGHLVMTTLHTNDGPATIARLRDMGIPGYLLEPALRLIVAQRLVRRVCPMCRQATQVDEAYLVPYGHTLCGLGSFTLYEPKGCSACSFTGFVGRQAIYEVMPITPAIQDLVIAAAPTNDIRRVAKELGMKTLREAGLFKVIEGVTTIAEALRVTTD